MNNSASRAILLVIALAVGAVAGVLWKKQNCDDVERQLRLAQAKLADVQKQLLLFTKAKPVYIGPTSGDVNPPDLYLSFSESPVVYWKPWLTGSGHKVDVVFQVAGFPKEAKGEPPFVNGTPNSPQHISCGGETCFSYDLNPNLLPLLQGLPAGLTYKYTQSVDTQAPVDGRIIINKGN